MSIYTYLHAHSVHILKYSYLINIQTSYLIFTIPTFINAGTMLSRFHVHIHYIHFFVFAYRQRCGGSLGHVEFVNLRLLRVGNDGNDCWWYQISSNIVGKPTKMTYHVSFGSRYQLDDTYNSIQWCARRSCRNGGFKIRERPWRYHAIESPCLVTELLLRRLSLDSKILLQIQWIQSRPIRAHACQLGRINK